MHAFARCITYIFTLNFYSGALGGWFCSNSPMDGSRTGASLRNHFFCRFTLMAAFLHLYVDRYQPSSYVLTCSTFSTCLASGPTFVTSRGHSGGHVLSLITNAGASFVFCRASLSLIVASRLQIQPPFRESQGCCLLLWHRFDNISNDYEI